MKKHYLFLLLIPFLYGCPTYVEPPILYYGPVPDSIARLIPYQDSVVYKFIHSKGYVVDFKADRNTWQMYGSNEKSGSSPLKKQIGSNVSLVSDYPAMDIRLNINNYDPPTFYLDISVQNTNFENYDFAYKVFAAVGSDSILVNNKYYKDIFVFKNYDLYNNFIPFADSLYYNKNYGIIKIFLRNGESYSIYN
jgi:hypothetical protein